MIQRFIYRICDHFGHWLTNVEDGHARCRVCRYHFFCGHASAAAIARWLCAPYA